MISIKKAIPGTVYPANLLPSSISSRAITWSHVGENERFTVNLWRDVDAGIRVFEHVWNEDKQDYETIEVPSESVSISLYI